MDKIDIVVDSNILISISRMFNAMPKVKTYKPRNATEYQILDLMSAMLLKKVNFLIVPTVLEELKRGSHNDNGIALRTVEKYCEIVKIDDAFQGKVFALAERYGNKPVGKGESVISYVKDCYDKNYNDASIVAETTFLSKQRNQKLILVTNNRKDFGNVKHINEINALLNYPKAHIYSVEDFWTYYESQKQKEAKI